MIGLFTHHVFVTGAEELRKAARPNECGVQISMARRAPFVVWVRGAGGRLQRYA